MANIHIFEIIIFTGCKHDALSPEIVDSTRRLKIKKKLKSYIKANHTTCVNAEIQSCFSY